MQKFLNKPSVDLNAETMAIQIFESLFRKESKMKFLKNNNKGFKISEFSKFRLTLPNFGEFPKVL